MESDLEALRQVLREGSFRRMDRAALIEELRASVPDLVVAYLFGSVARGDEAPGSDVDIALLAPGPLDPLARFDLQERLATLLGRDVDLVDLSAASTVMRVQVLADGEVLYDGDRAARERFEAFALADYARLNEERRAILDDIRRSGTIHG